MKIYRLYAIAALCIPALVGCTDALPEPDAPAPPAADMSRFWYSRTRSAAEDRIMYRHHALGFSYKAVTGERCNIADVMCQVLNLDYLKRNDMYFENKEEDLIDTCMVKRGIADYYHTTGWAVRASADLLIYQGEWCKESHLSESIRDSTLIFRNAIGLRTGNKAVDVGLLVDDDDYGPGEISLHPDSVLSSNFRYAIDKLRASGGNEAVVDSFINIFGTHVVTSVSQGGSFDLSVKTSKRFVKTYLIEEEFVRNAAGIFVKREKAESDTRQLAFENIFRSAEVSLSVKGGDVTVFDNLIADPDYDNAQASLSHYNRWIETVGNAVGEDWNSRSELIDMDVTPIWEFIPDKDIARRVKVRIVASAEEMRQLYGDRNFSDGYLDIETRSSRNQVFKPGRAVLPNLPDGHDERLRRPTGYRIVNDRIVAATYLEYVPEMTALGRDPMLTVTYPIYEGRLQLAEGIGLSAGRDDATVAYSVKYLYDRFVVDSIGIVSSDRWGAVRLWLDKGKLFTARPTDMKTYSSISNHHMDYEWPGSLDTEGRLTSGTRAFPVRKFMDRFYLDCEERLYGTALTDAQPSFDNLPGWDYYEGPDELISEYYMKGIFRDADMREVFEEAGMAAGTTHRMVRGDRYRYNLRLDELTELAW